MELNSRSASDGMKPVFIMVEDRNRPLLRALSMMCMRLMSPGLNHAVIHHPGLHPVGQSRPESRANQDDWDGRDFPGLHQGQRLKQLVQRTEATGMTT